MFFFHLSVDKRELQIILPAIAKNPNIFPIACKSKYCPQLQKIQIFFELLANPNIARNCKQSKYFATSCTSETKTEYLILFCNIFQFVFCPTQQNKSTISRAKHSNRKSEEVNYLKKYVLKRFFSVLLQLF